MQILQLPSTFEEPYRLPDSSHPYKRNAAVAKILDSSPSLMNGLSSREELSRFTMSYLHSEYARNAGILRFTNIGPGDISIEIPGIHSNDFTLVFFSQKSIALAPELRDFIKKYNLFFITSDTYCGIKVPDEGDGTLREQFLLIVSGFYTHTATSPLKHDIVSLLLENDLVEFSGGEKDIGIPPVGKSSLLRYTIYAQSGVSDIERFTQGHKAYYERMFCFEEERNSEKIGKHVHLTASGRSANNAVIQHIKNIGAPSSIGVIPGYFFLNEGDFPPGVKIGCNENTRSLFFSGESSYQGWKKENYQESLIGAIEVIEESARRNPHEPFHICIDSTTDLFGYLKGEVGKTLLKALKMPNIVCIVSASLTKYNRSQRNYHFGIICTYGAKNPLEGIDAAISYAHGDISPLGVIHFPRIRKSEIMNMQAGIERNRSAFLDSFDREIHPQHERSVSYEHHTAYSYLVPSFDTEKGNAYIKNLLSHPDLQKYIGSSFYHKSVRICDVPNISASRFYQEQATLYQNNLRISWPTEEDVSGMEDLAKIIIEGINSFQGEN